MQGGQRNDWVQVGESVTSGHFSWKKGFNCSIYLYLLYHLHIYLLYHVHILGGRFVHSSVLGSTVWGYM